MKNDAIGLNSSSSCHFPFDHILNREASNISNSSLILPQALTKKSSLKKMSILENQNFSTNRRISAIRNFDTAVTIDILNESDRFSRQSLEPLTNRESTSSKISSVNLNTC